MKRFARIIYKHVRSYAAHARDCSLLNVHVGMAERSPILPKWLNKRNPNCKLTCIMPLFLHCWDTILPLEL